MSIHDQGRVVPIEPALMSLKDAGKYLGGRSKDFVYGLIKQGKVEEVYLSERAHMVTKWSLDSYIADLLKEQKPK